MSNRLMSPREMGWWAAGYNLLMIIMLIVAACLIDWLSLGALVSFGVVSWLAGGQLAAWVFDRREK